MCINHCSDSYVCTNIADVRFLFVTKKHAMLVSDKLEFREWEQAHSIPALLNIYCLPNEISQEPPAKDTVSLSLTIAHDNTEETNAHRTWQRDNNIEKWRPCGYDDIANQEVSADYVMFFRKL